MTIIGFEADEYLMYIKGLSCVYLYMLMNEYQNRVTYTTRRALVLG